MARKVNDTQLLQLLSPKRKTITKRMLRSPVISLSAKKEKALNIENVKYKPVHILPFKEITNTGVTDNQKVCADHWNFKILMPIKVKLRVRLLQLFFFLDYISIIQHRWNKDHNFISKWKENPAC